MATTTRRPKAATKPRSGRAAAAGSGKQARKRAKPMAKSAAKPAKRAVNGAKPLRHPLRTSAEKLGLAALRAVLRKVTDVGASALQGGAGRAAEWGRVAGRAALEARVASRPVQASIDVAVPLGLAWDEWMTLESFTEGARRIEDVTREGHTLTGRTSGPVRQEWRAEIVDERPRQAFAWRSNTATDCAGLITFHRLSDRLTRIELDLDVVATGPVEAAELTLGVARRRAETELRRFKARVEFINPDVYETSGDQDDGDRDAAEPESRR